MKNCAVLGFSIDEDSCIASGKNRACQRCLQDEEARAGTSTVKRARKRCECGRAFSPTSNRQKSWPEMRGAE